jgi:hypothetical protein
MSRVKSARVTPRIAGSPVYGKNELSASPGNVVYKHQGKYHVFNGTTKVMVTEQLQTALAEAAKAPGQEK